MNESAKGYKKRSIRAICLDYKAEFIFGFVLIACVVLSYGLAPFIPIDFFNRHLSVIMNGCIASVCLFGAWIVWMHNDGIGVRKLWAGTLLIWAVLIALILMRKLNYNVTFDKDNVLSLHGQELVIGNFFAWLLLLYPTAVLRPKWLSLPKALLLLIPVAVIGTVDYFLPIDLRWLLTIYPVVLSVLLMWYHMRAVLPLNRTYLSQLINTEYGCNFYQYVTNYRIEEAKRMMREHPDMKMQDISEQCGFSSPTVFARVFAKETGVLPREWSDNS